MENTLASKVLAVQSELKAMTKDTKGFNYKYYDINQLVAELKPLLKKHELVVIQPLSHIDGKPALTTYITDGKTEWQWDTPLPTSTFSKTNEKLSEQGTDPQKMGAVITYYRRYALASFFLLEAEDDDAKSANSDIF